MSLDRIFAPTAINPRERITKWSELKKNGIGSNVGGKFLGYYIKPPEGKFKAQCVVILEDIETPTEVWGVSLPEYYKNEVQNYMKGDEVGYIYDRDIPAKEKGMSDTKHIQAYNQMHQDRLAKNIKVAPTEPGEHIELPVDDDFDTEPEETDINDIVK